MTGRSEQLRHQCCPAEQGLACDCNQLISYWCHPGENGALRKWEERPVGFHTVRGQLGLQSSRVKVRGVKATSEPASQARLCFSVYSASNLLVLLNDGILRKELRKKLPVVRIWPGAMGGELRDLGRKQ